MILCEFIYQDMENLTDDQKCREIESSLRRILLSPKEPEVSRACRTVTNSNFNRRVDSTASSDRNVHKNSGNPDQSSGRRILRAQRQLQKQPKRNDQPLQQNFNQMHHVHQPFVSEPRRNDLPQQNAVNEPKAASFGYGAGGAVSKQRQRKKGNAVNTPPRQFREDTAARPNVSPHAGNNQQFSEKKDRKVGPYQPLQKALNDIKKYSEGSGNVPPRRDSRDPKTPGLPMSEELEAFKQHLVLPLKHRSESFPNAKFYCNLCRRHINDVANVEKHISQDSHLNHKEVHDSVQYIRQLPSPNTVQTSVIASWLTALAQEERLSDEEVEERKGLVLKLEELLKENELKIKLNLHGSTITGLGLKISDVNTDISFPSTEDTADVLHKTYELLSSNDMYTNVQRDFQAKVPRIYFSDATSGASCDVSPNSSHACKTAKLIADYVSFDVRVQIMALGLRCWAKAFELDKQDKGSLPAHSFALMTIYFLQQCKPPVLPVLHELTKEGDGDDYLTPAQAKAKWQCQNKEDVGFLWTEMLRFYSADFPMNKRVICIRKKKPLFHSEKKWSTRFIAIEDPYTRKRNLAKSIPNEQVYLYFRSCLARTAAYFIVPQLHRGPLYTSLPKVENEQDNMEEYLVPLVEKGADAGDKDEDIDEEDSDNSSDSETPDLDDQDPELSFEEVASVVTNLDLPQEDQKVGNQKTSNTIKLSKSRCTLPTPLQKILDGLTEADFSYMLKKDIMGGKKLPLVCGVCQKMGHLRHECPDERLPQLKPLPAPPDDYINLLNKICIEVLQDYTPVQKEEDIRQKLLLDLEIFIRDLYKDAKLSLFGSSCNGFGFVGSDLDICLTFDSSLDGKDVPQAKIIEELARKLKTYSCLENIVPITTAKVPIVKFVHVPTNLEGDISLYNTLAQHNTRLLRMYSRIDERVRIIGYMLKHFARACDIRDASRGSLSSYAYTLMALYFLQQRDPPVIPVLQELHPGDEKKPEVLIEEWNVWFFEDESRLKDVWSDYGKNKESPGELWLGLLKFYTEEFDFKEYVISIRQKKPLSRLQKMWTTKSIAIEDPFDLNHNLGTGVSRKMNTYIMKTFIKGREIFGMPITTVPYGYSSYLKYFFNRRNLTDGLPPNDRGCRACGKIGHRVKECPQRRQTRKGKKNDGYMDRLKKVGNQECRPEVYERNMDRNMPNMVAAAAMTQKPWNYDEPGGYGKGNQDFSRKGRDRQQQPKRENNSYYTRIIEGRSFRRNDMASFTKK